MIEGYKRKRLPLRWQLLDARTRDQLQQSSDVGIAAEATVDRGSWSFWVAVPHGRARRFFFIEIQLYNDRGDVPLSRVRTRRFAGV